MISHFKVASPPLLVPTRLICCATGHLELGVPDQGYVWGRRQSTSSWQIVSRAWLYISLVTVWTLAANNPPFALSLSLSLSDSTVSILTSLVIANQSEHSVTDRELIYSVFLVEVQQTRLLATQKLHSWEWPMTSRVLLTTLRLRSNTYTCM